MSLRHFVAPLIALAAARADETAALQQSAKGAAPITGALRTGLYSDSDQTIVFRALGLIAGEVGRWVLRSSFTADVVSSASIDVRSSAALSKVDVTTTASGRTSTSGGKMFDRRLAASLGAGWNDGRGHSVNLNAVYANEKDYNSVGGGVNGSVDLFDRTTTLLGGLSFTQNWIGSTLDSGFAQKMYSLAWSIGVAQVLARRDALRLRYDGSWADGYQASPYRTVRFGDWTATPGANQAIMFGGTIGSPDGLPERLPDGRIRHALTAEWVHSFMEELALHTELRLGTDSWGVMSAAAGAELRVATRKWRARLGYRFYAQSNADFYRPKYLLAPENYAWYTSDKELSREYGHIAGLGISRVLKQPARPGAVPLLFDLTATYMHYDYPQFVLLKARDSGFVELGLTWEP
jgi:Protein of unknown function (DUF3570)